MSAPESSAEDRELKDRLGGWARSLAARAGRVRLTAGGAAGPLPAAARRPVALSTGGTLALVRRFEGKAGGSRVWHPETASALPQALDRFASGVAGRYQLNAQKYLPQAGEQKEGQESELVLAVPGSGGVAVSREPAAPEVVRETFDFSSFSSSEPPGEAGGFPPLPGGEPTSPPVSFGPPPWERQAGGAAARLAQRRAGVRPMSRVEEITPGGRAPETPAVAPAPFAARDAELGAPQEPPAALPGSGAEQADDGAPTPSPAPAVEAAGPPVRRRAEEAPRSPEAGSPAGRAAGDAIAQPSRPAVQRRIEELPTPVRFPEEERPVPKEEAGPLAPPPLAGEEGSGLESPASGAGPAFAPPAAPPVQRQPGSSSRRGETGGPVAAGLPTPAPATRPATPPVQRQPGSYSVQEETGRPAPAALRPDAGSADPGSDALAALSSPSVQEAPPAPPPHGAEPAGQEAARQSLSPLASRPVQRRAAPEGSRPNPEVQRQAAAPSTPREPAGPAALPGEQPAAQRRVHEIEVAEEVALDLARPGIPPSAGRVTAADLPPWAAPPVPPPSPAAEAGVEQPTGEPARSGAMPSPGARPEPAIHRQVSEPPSAAQIEVPPPGSAPQEGIEVGRSPQPDVPGAPEPKRGHAGAGEGQRVQRRAVDTPAATPPSLGGAGGESLPLAVQARADRPAGQERPGSGDSGGAGSLPPAPASVGAEPEAAAPGGPPPVQARSLSEPGHALPVARRAVPEPKAPPAVQPLPDSTPAPPSPGIGSAPGTVPPIQARRSPGPGDLLPVAPGAAPEPDAPPAVQPTPDPVTGATPPGIGSAPGTVPPVQTRRSPEAGAAPPPGAGRAPAGGAPSPGATDRASATGSMPPAEAGPAFAALEADGSAGPTKPSPATVQREPARRAGRAPGRSPSPVEAPAPAPAMERGESPVSREPLPVAEIEPPNQGDRGAVGARDLPIRRSAQEASPPTPALAAPAGGGATAGESPVRGTAGPPPRHVQPQEPPGQAGRQPAAVRHPSPAGVQRDAAEAAPARPVGSEPGPGLETFPAGDVRPAPPAAETLPLVGRDAGQAPVPAAPLDPPGREPVAGTDAPPLPPSPGRSLQRQAAVPRRGPAVAGDVPAAHPARPAAHDAAAAELPLARPSGAPPPTGSLPGPQPSAGPEEESPFPRPAGPRDAPPPAEPAPTRPEVRRQPESRPGAAPPVQRWASEPPPGAGEQAETSPSSPAGGAEGAPQLHVLQARLAEHPPVQQQLLPGDQRPGVALEPEPPAPAPVQGRDQLPLVQRRPTARAEEGGAQAGGDPSGQAPPARPGLAPAGRLAARGPQPAGPAARPPDRPLPLAPLGIQRQPAAAGSGSGETAAPVEVVRRVAEETGVEQEPGLSLEELARRVYPFVKRLLALERERLPR